MRTILGTDASIKTINEVELIRQYYFQGAKKTSLLWEDIRVACGI